MTTPLGMPQGPADLGIGVVGRLPPRASGWRGGCAQGARAKTRLGGRASVHSGTISTTAIPPIRCKLGIAATQSPLLIELQLLDCACIPNARGEEAFTRQVRWHPALSRDAVTCIGVIGRRDGRPRRRSLTSAGKLAAEASGLGPSAVHQRVGNSIADEKASGHEHRASTGLTCLPKTRPLYSRLRIRWGFAKMSHER